MWRSSCGKYYSVQGVVGGTWGGASTVQGYAGSQHPKAQEPAFSGATVTPTEEVTTKDSGRDASFILFQPGLRGRALLCPLTAPPGKPPLPPQPWQVGRKPASL